MATPTTKAAVDMMEKSFLKSIQPIWPNLTKRQTAMEFKSFNRVSLCGQIANIQGTLTNEKFLANWD